MVSTASLSWALSLPSENGLALGSNWLKSTAASAAAGVLLVAPGWYCCQSLASALFLLLIGLGEEALLAVLLAMVLHPWVKK